MLEYIDYVTAMHCFARDCRVALMLIIDSKPNETVKGYIIQDEAYIHFVLLLCWESIDYPQNKTEEIIVCGMM